MDKDGTSKSAFWIIEQVENTHTYYIKSLAQGRYLGADIQTGELRLRNTDPEDGFELIQAPNPGMIPAPQIVPVPNTLSFPLRTYWKSVPHNAYLVVNGGKVEGSKDHGSGNSGEWIVHYNKDDGFTFQSVSTGKFLGIELLQKVSINKISISKAAKFVPEWHSNGVFILRCDSGKYLGVDISLNVKANRLPATSTEEFIFEAISSNSISVKSPDAFVPGSPSQSPSSPKQPRMTGFLSGKRNSSTPGLAPSHPPQDQEPMIQHHRLSASSANQPPPLSLTSTNNNNSNNNNNNDNSHQFKRVSVSIKQSNSPTIFSVGEESSKYDGTVSSNLRDITVLPTKNTLMKGVYVIKACYPGKAWYVTLMPNGEVLTSPRPISSWTLEPSTTNSIDSKLCSCVIKSFQRDDDVFLQCNLPDSCSLKCGSLGTRFVVSSFEFPWDSAQSAANTVNTKYGSNFFTIQAVLNDSLGPKDKYYLSFVSDDQALNFVKSVDGTVSKMMMFEFIRIKTPTQLDIRTYPPLLAPFVPPSGMYPNM